MHDQHDQGLAHDLRILHQRRRALAWLTGAGTATALTLLGCGGGDDDTSTDTSATDTGTGTSTGTGSTTTVGTGNTSGGTVTSCSVIPEETAGPYPGDGSNTSGGTIANALVLSGIVRSDLRNSVAGATGRAAGVPLTLRLRLVNTRSSCADLSGYAIYLWHCDREGRYSMYSAGVTGENYLRGVQETGSDGSVTFTTIFPGCYAGRMPHAHFEIYRSSNSATSYSNKLKTSQLTFPVEVCNTLYRQDSGYATSLTNLSQMSLATDMVFSDGFSTQMSTVTGNVTDGYTATLVVGLSA